MPPTSPKESIFISYRRSDSDEAVNLMYRALIAHFGQGQVFLDRESIPGGANFAEQIKPAVENSKVMLVVIGSDWLNAKDGWKRRLDNPDDWVRQEIELALKNKRYVIPVLLNEATIPRKEELPQSIQGLLGANACRLITRENTTLFKAGMEGIIEAIEGNVPALKPPPPIALEQFKFKVVTLSISETTEEIKTGWLGRKTERVTRKVVNPERIEGEARQYIEDVGKGIFFEMVYIPVGAFRMGSPSLEEGSKDGEYPQHKVTVQPFFMGKYPVTQQLWKTVARLPKVALELNPAPSVFKGDTRPVENISWHEAVEFCKRLFIKTGLQYRLPTEAEWEYACRAGTTTPFHFGETITTDLANYNGNYTYKNAPKGVYRKETTPVDLFGIANAFGLCDMHGNVNEWCQDHWHSNYQGAPTDGIAWLIENENADRVVHGGSWDDLPGLCRSACRTWCSPDFRSCFIGFRVVCSAPRTL
ncbi:SUMF1/EgtB/PvdO family nonheme iron enzyme [Oscillatoria sp. FACHB-1407]|uniref:SUMF1/EgtB/PvdO family nonheme iron enzyme n=1 Tax=Oscillatoria sp. FACHB-1407 TaxID=2692847 RepID=UPI001684AB1B|nr:SUMF1/EgtB/PvdO family nonheme iron enzyme [Oscillatoria sp. FACHB-1407]MBD2461345.1 SUMF1/EgtB/PvdO family nonheme iron enzyme [Oscillatoria sp. FACHB-1407]